MDRLSFLKTIGTGIAAAVIAPKVVAGVFIEKPQEKDKEYHLAQAKKAYAHYEEDRRRITVDRLCVHDLCLDRNERTWMCTAMGFGVIELTALLAEPEPNMIDVDRDSFDEYFFIMGNAFSAGTGQPQ